MTDEKRVKLQAIRQRFTNLTAEDKEKLLKNGLVSTVEGHCLSMHNTILCYIQSGKTPPTVVAGYQQWKRAGRYVKRGEGGMTIWFPAGKKNDDDMEAVKTFYTASVFDISQTELLNTKESAPESKESNLVIKQAEKIIEQAPASNPIDNKVEALMNNWSVIK